MGLVNGKIWKAAKVITIVLLAGALSGCVSTMLSVGNKAFQPIPAALVAEMSEKFMSPSAPILVRIFKQESELEIWKQERAGRYALLKTYPMFRWSGKWAPRPRTVIDRRQRASGFYHVSSGMLNPESKYYLSLNRGYSNMLEAALGYTGDALMVHGASSSSGCYALTGEGVSEIYVVAREALKRSQTVFKGQAVPFRMTPRNIANNHNDPNLAFWTDLERGYDIFEVARMQPKVSYCGRHYVFDMEFAVGEPRDALVTCPPAVYEFDAAIASRTNAHLKAAELLVSSGGALAAQSYVHGGMHPSFRKLLERSGDKALVRNPAQLPDGPVLVVGDCASGRDIAVECSTAQVLAPSRGWPSREPSRRTSASHTRPASRPFRGSNSSDGPGRATGHPPSSWALATTPRSSSGQSPPEGGRRTRVASKQPYWRRIDV